jgi:hypothetical protein
MVHILLTEQMFCQKIVQNVVSIQSRRTGGGKGGINPRSKNSCVQKPRCYHFCGWSCVPVREGVRSRSSYSIGCTVTTVINVASAPGNRGVCLWQFFIKPDHRTHFSGRACPAAWSEDIWTGVLSPVRMTRGGQAHVCFDICYGVVQSKKRMRKSW